MTTSINYETFNNYKKNLHKKKQTPIVNSIREIHVSIYIKIHAFSSLSDKLTEKLYRIDAYQSEESLKRIRPLS